MKTLFIVLLGMFFVSCAHQNNSTTENKVINREALITLNIQVNGMTCEGCENTIKTALLALNGVDKVEASYLDSTTKIRFDSTLVNYAVINEEISKIGYEVVGLKKIF